MIQETIRDRLYYHWCEFWWAYAILAAVTGMIGLIVWDISNKAQQRTFCAEHSMILVSDIDGSYCVDPSNRIELMKGTEK